MVEQRRGNGPDKIIKQEHTHFITLIHQQTLSIQATSLSSFCLRLRVFVSFAVKFKFRSRESYDAYATSGYLILARRAAVATLTFSY